MRFAFVRRLITGGLCIIATYLVLMSAYVRVSTGVPVSLSNRLLNIDADASYAQQRRVMADWLAACRFIRASTPEDEVLLTPRHQQSFKWYAHRAEVVNWKDIPQDVASLEEWTNRMSEVYPSHLSGMRVTISYSGLREFARKYGVRWMLVDRRVVGDELPLVQIYPGNQENNQTYAVYQLPGPIESGPIDSGPIESGPIDSQKIAK